VTDGPRLRELARLFLRLGSTSFGGPAVHIAMTRDEVVTRREWMTDAEYADLIAMSNIVPGPNSTEVAIHVGRERAGWRGLLVAGTCFIAPAMVIVLALAWAYERYGTTPSFEWVLYGVKPVVIALVVQAIIGLSRSTLRGVLMPVTAGLALIATFAGINELVVLATGGLFVAITRGRVGRGGSVRSLFPFPLFGLPTLATSVSLGSLFLTVLKIGTVLYGSGYVLFAFLRTDFVIDTGWLTEQQLLDAIAIGQATPGPLFTTATFVGYVLAGFPGAIVATVGIFLPAFVFVALTNPLLPRIRRSVTAGAFLDGVVAASLALMAAVTWYLGKDSIVDGWTVLLALASTFVLLRWKPNSVWLVLGGAIAGFTIQSLS
jgi:chromate transporter